MAIRTQTLKAFNGKNYAFKEDIEAFLWKSGETAFTASSTVAGAIAGINSDLATKFGTLGQSKIVATNAAGTGFDYTLSLLAQGSSTGSVIGNSATDAQVPSALAVYKAINAVGAAAISVAAGTGISITESGTQKTIATNVKLVNIGTTGTDYAARYQLQFTADGETYSNLNEGATIDIPKDQFLKSADFGWATAADGTGFVLPSSKTASTTVPVIKFVVYTTTNGTTADKTLFVDCTSFYHAISVSSESVYTASGVTAAILSESNGVISAGNVQTAIDYAVTSAAATVNATIASKAVELVETDVTLSAGTSNGITVAISSGVVTVSGVPGNILAVFDANGVQIAPEITKTGAKTAASNTLVADYGTETLDAKWTILHTKAIVPTAVTANGYKGIEESSSSN